MKKLILLAGLIAVLLSAVAFAIVTGKFSPAQNTPTRTPTVERDPVKSFKELVTRFPRRDMLYGATGYWETLIMDVTFDVKQTDSLINPVIGIINFTQKISYSDSPLAPDSLTGNQPHRAPVYFKVQMVFHWQGHWTFERFVDGERIGGGDIPAFPQRKGKWGKEMSDFLKSVQ